MSLLDQSCASSELRDEWERVREGEREQLVSLYKNALRELTSYDGGIRRYVHVVCANARTVQ